MPRPPVEHDTLPCRVYWGSHGCCLPRGHDGPHLCDCTFDGAILIAHADDPDSDTGNVGRPPYYGPQTVFYGPDSPPWPTTCAEVEYEPGFDYREPEWDANLGDVIWDPKAGKGHVLTSEVPCVEGRGGGPNCGCGGWGSERCTSTTLICECGECGADRDHHYYILARAR